MDYCYMFQGIKMGPVLCWLGRGVVCVHAWYKQPPVPPQTLEAHLTPARRVGRSQRRAQ